MNKFIKLNTSGNDFLLFLNKIKINFLKKKINKKIGIYSDQIFIINNINYKINSIKIKIFNINLNEADNCGNGIRCLSWFFLFKKKKIIINFFLKKNIVYSFKIKKKNYIIYKIPNKKIKFLFRFKKKFLKGFFIDLFNLHIIFIISNIKSYYINIIIKKFVFFFGDIYNIEFLQIINKKKIYIRIFERNIGETYSCGSGIISSSYLFFSLYLNNNLLYINSIGGICNILIKKKFIFYYGKEFFNYIGYI